MKRNIDFSSHKKPHGFFRLHLNKLFIIYFFSFACTSTPSSSLKSPIALTSEERAQLHYLFNQLFFYDFGVYVLFGSKPMAVMALFDEKEADECAEKEWEKLSEAEKKAFEQEQEELRVNGKLIEKLEYNPYECWKVLQRINAHSNMKKYIFAVWPVEDKPYLHKLYIADVQKTALIIEENYDLFRGITNEDFHPLEIVFEMNNVHSSFWNKVFKSHLTHGILLGFGRKNSMMYNWVHHYEGNNPKVKNYIQISKWKISTKKEINEDQASSSNFSIPVFGCSEKDHFVKNYKKERKEILKIYKGKNMVDVTLDQLYKD